MSLIYRGRKFVSNIATAQTVSTSVKGTYRGATVAVGQGVRSVDQSGAAKQYRGVTY